jgi:Uncharacterized protein conserved in bacteria C-term(DUF2220)
MNPTLLPVACELFAQWQHARGSRTEPATRPFSRGWEDLLEDARLISAADRNDAERDARMLASSGWIEIIPVRYKLHLIDRIMIPLAAEMRWRQSFGFVPPSDEEARLIHEFNWEPALAFLRDCRLNIPFATLCQLNDFLKRDLGECPLVPIKERSLGIFGDEKRLDTLVRGSALFGEGRLTPEMLHCFIVPEPLPWTPGPDPAGPILIIENAATWHSYCRWNAERKYFSAVIYGCGNRFLDGIRSMNDIFSALGGPRRVLYFGDLDPQGLFIPKAASTRAQAIGLPAVEPHLWSYRQLLTLGAGHAQPRDGDPLSSEHCDWLGECAEPVRQLFAAGHRLAQEHVGWEFLQDKTEID